MKAQAAVELLLTERIGLDVASIGPALITRAMESRMAERGVTDSALYASLVASDEIEMRALIDLVVVTESWFFRDLRPFLRLQTYVRDEWKPRGLSRFRVLSVPCARGEEAYSLAIALLDAGLAPEQICVEAVDVSEAVLKQARTGAFRATAFRQDVVGDPAHYLAATPDGFEVRRDIRSLVRFHQGNLLDGALLADEPEFDAVFCRNVLIYLTSAAREAAVAKLKLLLGTNGLLFVGHAEALTILREHFVADADVPSFAYRKLSAALLNARVAVAPAGSFQRAPGRSSAQFLRPFPVAPTAPKAAKTVSSVSFGQPDAASAESSASAKLAQASQLADRKEYARAARLCHELLNSGGPDARVYLLLGMIELEAGRSTEAEAYLHKVAYLDNSNVEALLALASLARQRGDLEEAERRSRRADRVRRLKSGPSA